MSAVPGNRQFNALTGKEIKEIILKQIAAAFDADDNFVPHLTYPVVEWDWKLQMRAYPHYAESIPLTAEGEIDKTGRQSKAELQQPVQSEMTGDHKTDIPDLTREEFGLPVTIAEKNTQGRVVDIPRVMRPTIELPDEEGADDAATSGAPAE